MRPIDADAYAAEMKTRQDELKELMDDADALENWEMYYGLSRAFSVFVEARLTLDAMPTIGAVPVVHGEWVEADLDKDFRRCSVCKNKKSNKTAWSKDFVKMFFNYCPNCGAKMDAKEGTKE